MSNSFVSAAGRAVEWLKLHALPLWADAGFAVGPDFFREALDFSGAPIQDLPLRSRVQGRQMYVYGHATELGWFDGREILARSFSRGYAWFRDAEGGYVASLTPDMKPADATRYAYEQAFVLLGFAWHERIFKNGEAVRQAEALWRWIEATLAAPATGGFVMGVPLPDEPLSQNPHMHLFEACLNWHAVAGDPVWLERARRLFALFTGHFYDARYGVLREFFAEDLTPTVPQSNRIDSGHQAEWIWLLAWYKRVTGETVEEYSTALWRIMERFGRNPNTGLLFEEFDIDGKPLIETSRFWSATEVLKASLTRYEAAGREGSTGEIETAVAAIFRYHLDGVKPGLWMDKVDRDGAPIAKTVPASTFYHLFLAFAELHRVANGQRPAE